MVATTPPGLVYTMGWCILVIFGRQKIMIMMMGMGFLVMMGFQKMIMMGFLMMMGFKKNSRARARAGA